MASSLNGSANGGYAMPQMSAISALSTKAIDTVLRGSAMVTAAAASRIRTVRLVRPHLRPSLLIGTISSFGFSVRGGKEYGTGIFVSSVDRNGEAAQKGLCVSSIFPHRLIQMDILFRQFQASLSIIGKCIDDTD